MRSDIHPDNYREVIFKDISSGDRFLISSTIETEQTDTWEDGQKYPFVEVEISSASHPFYTGQEKVLDTTGRVERFKQRQAKAQQVQPRTKKAKARADKTEKDGIEQHSTSTEGGISIG